MRLSKLQVENFKAITSAQLEFGPGLNVLYGPNDLGKSTLGVALRAALLLPSTSSTAAEYVPWQEQATPIVTLTFLTEVARHWRVVKHFTQNDATLSFSKDGKDFSADSHERAVDEKLRQLLGWGLATPGGRGGPRGMPESFLANALLAAQTDVDGILRSSLESDLDSGGKLKLTAALSALAEDPLVRHVLDRAMKEHELHFSKTGRKKSGQNAPLTQASDEVKKLTDELMVQHQALSQSLSIEQEARRLQQLWLEAQQRAELAEQSLERARAGLQRSSEKRAAEERRNLERQALVQVDGLATRVKDLDAEITSLGKQVTAREAALESARAAAKAAALALREAEEAHRKASSADGEAERAVARATLREERAKHAVTRAELVARLERAKEGQQAVAELTRLNEVQRKLAEQLGPARERLAEATDEAALTSALMNYGHWRTAGEAAKSAEQWSAEAKRLRAQALEKSTERARLQENARQLEEEVAARRSTLPDEKQRAAFRKLRHDSELAEAALGGGVTVLIRPKDSLLLRSTADENPTEEKKVAKELSIEADRRVQLSIGALVEIEVITGAAEKRKDADHLRRKWKTDALPALEKASVRSLSELDEVFAELTFRLEKVMTLRQSAVQLDAEIETLRGRAGMLEEKVAGAPSAQRLEEKRAQVGSYSFEALQPIFDGMGANWESEARPLNEKKSAALAQATVLATRLEAELTLTEHRLSDAKEKAPGNPEEVAPVEQALATLEKTLSGVEEKLAQLEKSGSSAKKQATTQREQAQHRLEQAEAAAVIATDAVTAARASENGRKGERDATRAQLKEADRAAVSARLQEAEKHLATFADVEVLSPAELAQRARAVELARVAAEQAGRDYANAEGALSTVGGPQGREQVRQLEEALMVARARERLIEVDAASWKLLVDAVREAEKEDSSSLGSALAGPVTARFAELTQGRYPAVKFDPSLRALGVEVPGTQSSPDSMLAALSVGTRDHLATLVRLSIALQLKSAIVLDDHLVHTDLGRLAWFREALRQTAAQTQVVVLTCRPLDYVSPEALPTTSSFLDSHATRVIDLSKVIKRR